MTYFSAHRGLGPKSDWRENNSHPLCTAHFAPVLRRFPLLHGSGAGIPGILIYSWYCGIGISSGVEMLRRQRDELTAQMIEMRQRSSSTAMNTAVTGLTEAVRTMGQSVSKPRPEDMSRKARAVRTKQRLWRLGLHVQRIRGYSRSCLSCLAERQRWWWQLHHTNSSRQPYCTFSRCSHRKGAQKVVRKAGNNGFEACRQLCLMYGTVRSGRQHWTIRANHDIQVRFQDWRRGWPSEWISGTGETIRWGEPIPDQVKKACIVSNTHEPLKTHLQLNVGKFGNFNALRVATEDYLRSRRIFKTTSAGNTHDEDSMEVDAVSRKGKGKEKSGKGKKGGKKGKECHSGKGYGETTTEHSRFEGECGNCAKYGHKASDCWYTQTNKSQGKGKGTGKSKSKVTEISECDNSRQVDDWCPSPNTSAQQPNLSQVTRLDAQMRDSGYFRWKTARNVGTRWIGKISLVPLRLRNGKLGSTSWWSILDVLDMSAHHGLHRNFQWWVLQTL